MGSATNAPATNRPTPTRAVILFSALLGKPANHTARLAVHLLRAAPARPDTLDRAARVAERLAQLAAVLDNYMHPSNTGAPCRLCRRRPSPSFQHGCTLRLSAA